MALTETTRDVKGTTLTFIETDAEGNGIYKEGLSDYDYAIFEKIDADGTGASLFEKMEGYTLSNGRNAAESYAQAIVDIDAYAALRLKKAIAGTGTSATIADHEGRIAALEAAPEVTP